MDVEKVANLAKLMFRDEEEKRKTEAEFKKILDFVNKIQELNLEGIEPLTHPHEGFQRLRKDVPQKGLSRDEALRDAPEARQFFFKVPSPLKGVSKK